MEILVVEDKDSLRTMLRRTLESEGYEVAEAADGEEAFRLLDARRFAAVLTDLRLPGHDGLAVLERARERDPRIPVIVLTAYGTVEKAVEALKGGAYDFLSKPVDTDHLLHLLGRALERRRLETEVLLLREEFSDRLGAPRIVGESPELKAVSLEIQKVAGTDATVLLLGESGTGKELFARVIHHLSPRKDGPFLAINCAAIPDNLLENELFGHEKGAFTGAAGTKLGKMELAAGGTVFLDEVGDLSPAVQAKILRVLQERSFERVGGNTTLEVDVRVVAATNKDLQALVDGGGFREDLYFRLSVFPVTIPPLRDRSSDIPLLVDHFVERCGREMGRAGVRVSGEARRMLEGHDWPGNVREMENCIERAVILCEGDEIRPADLALPVPGEALEGEQVERLREMVDFDGSLQEVAGRAARMAERVKIRQALEETKGNKSAASRLLGVSYKTLLNKIKDLDL
jgi:DNA-binding NtrC family response regulator